MDPILGQIILWPGLWVPQGWFLCDGSLLQVQQYTALYSIIGTKYGGNGTTTFGLPDLRSKVPIGSLVASNVGGTSGSASVNLSGIATATGMVSIGVANLPSHTHTATFTPGGGSSSVSIAIPVNSAGGGGTAPGTTSVLGVLADGTGAAPTLYSTAAANTTLKPFSVNVPAGGGTVSNANTGNGTALPISLPVSGSVSTIQPSLTLNYIIAWQGIYPERP